MPQDIFTIAVDADDFRVYGTGPTYPPAYTFADDNAYSYCWRWFDGSAYWILNSLWRWDTSTLPDTAIITGATFRATVDYIGPITSRNWVGSWTSWVSPPTSADYHQTALTDAHSGTVLSALTTGAQHDFPLTGFASGVNKVGYTYLQGAVDGGIPTGENSVNFRAIGNTQASTPAQLIVDYTVATPTRMAPDAIVSQTNLTGLLSAIQDDPDSPDANWLTAP